MNSDKKMNNVENESMDEDIRDLVSARLQILDSNTLISIGDDGEFTPEQLINHVEKGDKIGKKISQIQMEWLRSFKEELI